MLDTVAGVVAGFSFIDSEHSKEARIHKPVPAYTSKGTSAVKSLAKKRATRMPWPASSTNYQTT